MDVRYLGTANAVLDPAHDVAKNSLSIIVQFLLNFGASQSIGIFE